MTEKLGDTIILDFTTVDPVTGAAIAADSTPTCSVYQGASDTAVLTPTPVARAGVTGVYRVSVALTTGNGFSAGNTINVDISVTVNGVTSLSTIATFYLESKRVSDLNDIAAGAAMTLTSGEHTLVSGTDVPAGLTTQGYTTARAGYLDTLNGLVAAIATAVWAATARTLSAFGFTVATNSDSNVTAIKAKTDNLPASPAAVGSEMTLSASYDAAKSAASLSQIENSTVLAKEASLSAISEGLSRVLGLVHENFRITDPVYSPTTAKMTSCTLKLYPSATDCTNDTNVTTTYTVTATYDSTTGTMTTYKVVKN